MALLLLTVTVSLGPLNLLRKRPNPVSADLRRDFGIWTAIVGIVHVIIGLQVHMGSPVRYFIVRGRRGAAHARFDPFGIANYTGAIATLILLVLLALSSDAALRTLGAERWKSLQRWTYGLGGLVLVHAAVYQLLEKRALPLVLLLVVATTAGVGFQLSGRRARARNSHRTSR